MVNARGELVGVVRDLAKGGIIAQFRLSGTGEELAELTGHDVDVKVSKHREKRSLDANAYAWVLMDKLAEKTGIDKLEIYRQTIRNIGGVSDTLCLKQNAAERFAESWQHNGIGWFCDFAKSRLAGCVNAIIYYGSSTYDTAQMSRLIDLLVQECKVQNIETLPPEKLAAMKGEWG